MYLIKTQQVLHTPVCTTWSRRGIMLRTRDPRAPVHCFMGMGSLEHLASRLGDPPRALVPASVTWPLFKPEVNAASAARRQRQRRQVLDALASCRMQLPLVMPPLPPPNPGDEADPPPASNAVPFAVGEAQRCGSTAAAVDAVPGPMPRAEHVHRVLPWLYTAIGSLDLWSVEHLASHERLDSLLLLDLSKRRPQWLPPGVHWAGSPQPLLSTAVGSAAALRRMDCRQRAASGSGRGLSARQGHVVLLVYTPEQGPLAAETLALFLHLYAYMDLREAAQAAGRAITGSGGPPVMESLQRQCLELVGALQGWKQRVELTWAYSASQVELVGDAVGSWERRVPLVFDVARRLWAVQLWGLPPGQHRYKFIVDGAWCIDQAAPTETDLWGNINNVVAVQQPLSAAKQQRDDSSTEAAMLVGDALPCEQRVPGGERVWSAEELAGSAPPTCGPEELTYLARLGAAMLAMQSRLQPQRRLGRSALV